ncbi:MAG: lipoate--protein ligase family protein [Candidatus Saganbacteria bacterium]|nr:lipoate--protein ligase family protein [Candidatus Saganbacteria bacterium]
MKNWDLLKNPGFSGSDNMEYDLQLFHDFEHGSIPSTLRIYSWQPKCISYGYSQNIEQELEVVKARQLGWDIVKRPTGGGIVFHNEAEVTYSVVTALDDPKLPDGLIPSYKKLSEAVVWALNSINVPASIRAQNLPAACLPARQGKAGTEPRTQNPSLCFAVPAEYEIVVAGRKIVGAAQKRGRGSLLQQGSIFVRSMGQAELDLLLDREQAYNAVSVEEVLGKKIGFEQLSQALEKGFEQVLAIELEPATERRGS